MCVAANIVTYDLAECKHDWFEDGGRRAPEGDLLSNAGDPHSHGWLRGAARLERVF